MIDTTEAYGLSFSFPAGDQTVGACLKAYGEFSKMGMLLASQAARGNSFVDVGANIGAFCLPVSRTATSVVAIEAHPGLATILRRNVEANNILNVQVVHAAAGATTGQLDFPSPPLSQQMNFGSIGIGRTDAPVSVVDVVKLDDVSPSNTRMVKIDVEGFEMEVLKGAERLLQITRPSWLIEYSDPSIVDLMHAADYRTYWFFDAFVTPTAPKQPYRGKYLGDMSVLAVPANAPQPAGMVEACPGSDAPESTAGFEYLRTFGIKPTPSERQE